MINANTYVYELMKTSIDLLLESRFGYYAARPLLVYHLQKTKGGFLPLNRDYKPLGISRQEWADYEGYNFMIIPESDVVLHDELKDEFFLFGDATTPRIKTLKIKYINNLKKTFPKLKKTDPLNNNESIGN